jgi:hypothetical protein
MTGTGGRRTLEEAQSRLHSRARKLAAQPASTGFRAKEYKALRPY